MRSNREWMLKLVIFSTLFVLYPAIAENIVSEKEKIYRVGYLEPYSSWVYTGTLEGTKRMLEDKGWKNKVIFPEDAHFSPGRKNEQGLKVKAKELMDRKDLDAVLVMGTRAVRTILEANEKNDDGHPAIIGAAVSDPVREGFVLSENDSGVDNFTVHINPGGYKRMLKIFHTQVRFKKLGLLYLDEKNKNAATSYDDAIEISKVRGFEILEFDLSKYDLNADIEGCLQGLKELVILGMDAFFVPALDCFDGTKNDPRKMYNLLMKKKIPSFARQGDNDVKLGALMGGSTMDFDERGKFLANNLIKIFEGERPRSLPMVREILPRIILNLYVANQIGFDFSPDLLGASDEIYQDIIWPPSEK